MQSESGVSSDDPDNERHNIFMRSEVAPRLQFNENFFIDGVAVLEPTRTSSPGDDTFFENEGVFIEEIKLNYENGPFAAFGGKFNPGFGIAWDYGRGIWSEEFAEDYEITEKIGFGLAYTLETESFGSYTLTGSTFFADTSFLAESGITGRDQLHLSDGGASNTEDLSSFVLSLDSESLAGIENLSYHFAFRHLAEGSASSGGADEQGFATNLRYVIPFSDALQSDVLLEYAGLCNVDGGTEDSRYYTASVVNKIYENWNLTVGFTNRIMTMAGSPDIDDHLLQLTAGYDFGNGLTLEAGWRNSNEAGTANNILGGLARYTFEF
ncbi:MAG: hypothetical protein GC131_00140 [Alphaproteobacteria bacterium]|nr:hypothetical protein [Alphaproteobacteria bacterium]